MSDYTAFAGTERVAAGPLAEVLAAVKPRFDRDPGGIVLIFEDQTGKQVDFDLRGTLEEVVARAQPPARTGPGRPKLGVVAREVSLLPRHWEWLEQQPSGASAALRKLVEEASRRDPAALRIQAAGRFLSAMASSLPDYEEAARALWARDGARFAELTAGWPAAIRQHAQNLVGSAS